MLFDRNVLLFVHEHVPHALDGFFQAVTMTGSSLFVLPLAAVVVLGLRWRGHGSEAWLVALSTGLAEAVVWSIKFAVGRSRPGLWATDTYWGSSFPSGHTLVVAAFAIAAVLGVGRLWPGRRRVALAIAFAWIFLVALSRLVLGVHWPTDVLAAAGIGALLPLAIDMAQTWQREKKRRPDSRTP